MCVIQDVLGEHAITCIILNILDMFCIPHQCVQHILVGTCYIFVLLSFPVYVNIVHFFILVRLSIFTYFCLLFYTLLRKLVVADALFIVSVCSSPFIDIGKCSLY